MFFNLSMVLNLRYLGAQIEHYAQIEKHIPLGCLKMRQCLNLRKVHSPRVPQDEVVSQFEEDHAQLKKTMIWGFCRGKIKGETSFMLHMPTARPGMLLYI